VAAAAAANASSIAAAAAAAASGVLPALAADRRACLLPLPLPLWGAGLLARSLPLLLSAGRLFDLAFDCWRW
jgi:hypothetical protein